MSEKTTEDLEKELEEVREALHEANEEAKKFRLERNDLRDQLKEAETNNVWKEKTIHAEAKLALADMGLRDADRILKYVKFDEVDIDDGGKIVGLEDEVNNIKEDFPELFDKKRQAGDADITNKSEPDTEDTAAKKLASQLLKT